MEASRSSKRPCRCNVCNREFRRPEHLRRHERIHSNEKPFVCPCGRAFSRQDLLRRHEIKEGHGRQQLSSAMQAALDPASSESAIETSPNLGQNATMEVNAEPGKAVARFGAAEEQITTAMALQNGIPVNAQSLSSWTPDESDWTRDTSQMFDASFMIPTDLDLSHCVLLDGFDFSYNDNGLGSVSTQEAFMTDVNPISNDVGPANGHEIGENGTMSRFGSPLPSLPAEVHHADPRPSVKRRQRQGKLTETEYRLILEKLDQVKATIPGDFRMPSRQALSRYLRGYLKGLNEHIPVLHAPNLSISKMELCTLLSMATIGAHWCFEATQSERLFFATKTMILHKLDGRVDNFSRTTARSGTDVIAHLALLQALLNLMIAGTWGSFRLLREALSLQSTAARIAREIGFVETSDSHKGYVHDSQSLSDRWTSWVQDETRRRTLLMVYCYFNVISLAYDIPPVLLSSEIQLRMPSSPALWAAENADAWWALHVSNPSPSMYFADCIASLMADATSARQEDSFSSLDNYISIIALLQRIFFLRETFKTGRDSRNGELEGSDGSQIRAALLRWQSRWERSPDSNVDFPTWTGPIPFTSTAFLRLAWIRLSMDSGPCRNLASRNPQLIAETIFMAATVRRSPQVTMPVLQAIYALAVPVQTGIQFVSRAQTVSWSVQHSLCNLECAIFLTKWLEELSNTIASESLSTDERRLLAFIRSLVYETGLFDEDERLTPLFEHSNTTSRLQIRLLAVATASVWAKIFEGPFAFPFVDIVGASLRLYAGLLEQSASDVATNG